MPGVSGEVQRPTAAKCLQEVTAKADSPASIPLPEASLISELESCDEKLVPIPGTGIGGREGGAFDCPGVG
jgi:hypothetical protein